MKTNTYSSAISFPDIKPLRINRYAKIVSTGVGVPKKVMTNQDIIDKYDYVATDRAIQFSIGIKERRWVSEDESFEGLMAEAITQCLERANVNIEEVDRIIYTKLLSVQNIPASTVAVLKKLGVKKGIPGFDVTCACSGFVHVMDMALKYIATGDDYVLILEGEYHLKDTAVQKSKYQNSIFIWGWYCCNALGLLKLSIFSHLIFLPTTNYMITLLFLVEPLC